jgi:hypothetical protein
MPCLAACVRSIFHGEKIFLSLDRTLTDKD